MEEFVVQDLGGWQPAAGIGIDMRAREDQLSIEQAIAELPVSGRDEGAALERAGMDAVIVPAGNVAELVGGSAPEV